MYWAISCEYSCQDFTNFYFDGHVYSFTKLPMGWTNRCFTGQQATEMTFSQETIFKFLKMRGFELNSKDWPFLHVSEHLIVYMADIVVFSPDDIDNHIKVYLNLMEFMIWATQFWGFKIGPAKFSPWMRRFKFLGHYFYVDKSTTSIHPTQIEAFKQFRPPAC